jgi:hypothetical protein
MIDVHEYWSVVSGQWSVGGFAATLAVRLCLTVEGETFPGCAYKCDDLGVA